MRKRTLLRIDLDSASRQIDLESVGLWNRRRRHQPKQYREVKRRTVHTTKEPSILSERNKLWSERISSSKEISWFKGWIGWSKECDYFCWQSQTIERFWYSWITNWSSWYWLQFLILSAEVADNTTLLNIYIRYDICMKIWSFPVVTDVTDLLMKRKWLKLISMMITRVLIVGTSDFINFPILQLIPNFFLQLDTLWIITSPWKLDINIAEHRPHKNFSPLPCSITRFRSNATTAATKLSVKGISILQLWRKKTLYRPCPYYTVLS